eukprot:6186339-Pleurochrysis_carterae.AAC.6
MLDGGDGSPCYVRTVLACAATSQLLIGKTLVAILVLRHQHKVFELESALHCTGPTRMAATQMVSRPSLLLRLAARGVSATRLPGPRNGSTAARLLMTAAPAADPASASDAAAQSAQASKMPAGVLHICGTGEYLKLGLGDQQVYILMIYHFSRFCTPRCVYTGCAHAILSGQHGIACVPAVSYVKELFPVSFNTPPFCYALLSHRPRFLCTTQDRESPVPVAELADMDVTHVACGKFHTACITAAGDVYAWGLEGSGQLGLGSTRTKAPTPKKVEELSGIGVKQLSCVLARSSNFMHATLNPASCSHVEAADSSPPTRRKLQSSTQREAKMQL